MSAQKTWASIIGVVLLLVGIIGFFNNPVLGLFPVNPLHSIVHLITGFVFFWAGMKTFAKPANQWLGIIYVLVAVLGFLGALSFLNVAGGNDPDNYLHLAIGLVSVIIGFTAAD